MTYRKDAPTARLYPMHHRPHIGLFLMILLVPGILFLYQIWQLLPLYTQSSVRESVRSVMIDVADREGWLLSDMLVTEITVDQVRMNHREHLRGSDSETCYVLTLKDSSLTPCDAKLN